MSNKPELGIEIVEWSDPRAIALRGAMDAETGLMYADFSRDQSPEVQSAIDSVLTVDPATIEVTVVATVAGEPVGHSALRPFGDELEVKKVFVTESVRGTGVARALLAWLEEYAVRQGVASLVLQTGPLQHDAIALYEKIGYVPIAPYGGYDVIPGALCYRKSLVAA